jgi:hypothetical protein
LSITEKIRIQESEMRYLKQGILFITPGPGLSGLQAADWQALPEVAPAPADNPATAGRSIVDNQEISK